MKKIGLRIDIDSIGDVKAIPPILEMLKEHDLKASFFVTTGPDKTSRNLKNYLRKPSDILRAKPERFGLFTLIKGFIRPESIQEYNTELTDIMIQGHEIGLHGYDHYRWTNTQMDKEEIKEALNRGILAFEQIFKKKPTSFASPGFIAENNYLKILDKYDFTYSSDFISNWPFYPQINGEKTQTIQIPVLMKSPGELAIEGMSDDTILQDFKEQIALKEFFTFYIHPSYECIYKKKLLNKMLSYCSEIKNNLTFNRIYEDLKDENTPNL